MNGFSYYLKCTDICEMIMYKTIKTHKCKKKNDMSEENQLSDLAL